MRRGLVLGPLRELGTVGLVAGLCGFYAAALVMASSFMTVSSRSAGGGAGLFLAAVSTVFILIALYVSTVVIVNCVDTVIAGRLRQIALLRLLGAASSSLRREVMRGTALAGLLGATIGAFLGTLVADLFRVVLVARGTVPHDDYPWLSAFLVPPVLTIALAALVAGWLGSRSVLRVTPAQAMSGSAVEATPSRRGSTLRTLVATVLVLGGAALLGLAALLGEGGSVAGFLVAFVGSAVSASGLLVGARQVIPWTVSTLNRPLGSAPADLVARRNAVKDPLRTTRSTMGLVIGVTLVTTFASGMNAIKQSVSTWPHTSVAQAEQTQAILTAITAILIAIVVISSIVSAVGFVSTMSLTVIQRRREIGLLRALGFTRAQVRRMITVESAALSGAAVLLGILLGLVYGSVGAQSMVGKVTDGFVWGLPWPVLAAIAVGGVLLVLIAARPPARRAVTVTPIEALRVG